MDTISFLTFTNFGYLHFTQNLILSLEKINFPLTLKVYCIDQKSYDSLQNWNKNIILEMLNDETNTNQNIVGWKENGWNTMVFSKLKCIYKELFKNEYVFFTDSDIVFEKDPLEYLLENIKDYDMLIQLNRDNFKYLLNTGFMFIKSNNTMKDLFDSTRIKLDTFTCDQDYINEKSYDFKFMGLPRDLFPVEYYYYLNYKNYSDKFYIFHFNFKKGNDKKERIINMNKWYLIEN